jgi:hypothetical protein
VKLGKWCAEPLGRSDRRCYEDRNAHHRYQSDSDSRHCEVHDVLRFVISREKAQRRSFSLGISCRCGEARTLPIHSRLQGNFKIIYFFLLRQMKFLIYQIVISFRSRMKPVSLCVCCIATPRAAHGKCRQWVKFVRAQLTTTRR